MKARRDPLARLSCAEVARRLQRLQAKPRLSSLDKRLKARLEFYHRHKREGA